MATWPTVDQAAAWTGLTPEQAADPAYAQALAAARSEASRLAPDRAPEVGPVDDAVVWAVAVDATGLYRARGSDTGVLGPDGFEGSAGTADFPTVRRLLGVGYYARPRIG